jgi:hypothetical protein
MRLVDQVLKASAAERIKIYTDLSNEERLWLDRLLDSELNNPFARFDNDPVGFITEGLGETLWSVQRDIAKSVRDNQRTAIPACHAPGKSHLAARLVTWWIAKHAVGTALAITIAPTHRQVRNIMWSQIRKAVISGNLPGEVLTQTWKIDNTMVAYGFSPSHYDEAALQGIHAPNLLIVVDEAGGIGEVIGQSLEALMTGGNTKIVLLGNPPTDQEDSWFERSCNSPLYNVIPISALDTPNFTGEEVGVCKSCPSYIAPHSVATHLVDKRWVDDVVSEFGEDSGFVQARVHAKFPRVSVGRVIPFNWCESAAVNENPAQSDIIKLGIDIAADGGDEFVVAKADGFTVTIEHRSSGAANANAMDVAGVCMEHIEAAVKIHEQREVKDRVPVKVDTIGVGWGVVSILKKWVSERGVRADVIGVNVAERAKDQDKFKNQRAEMWWNTRQLLQPVDGKQEIKLKLDRATMAQLSGPTYKSDSAGRIQIESKADMKRRGMNSPDRAEAVLLALYESRTVIPTIAPLSFEQSNQWNFG